MIENSPNRFNFTKMYHSHNQGGNFKSSKKKRGYCKCDSWHIRASKNLSACFIVEISCAWEDCGEIFKWPIKNTISDSFLQKFKR